MVMTTFPRACPSSRYRIASGTSLRGYVLSITGDFDGPLGFNAIPILENLDIPLLYLFGGNDRGGPLQANLAMIDELVGGGADLAVQVYDGVGHLLPGVDFWPDVASWLDDKDI